MADTGIVYAGSGAEVAHASGTVGFTNESNITADDNTYAECAFGSGSGASSEWLYASNFNFSSIPDGSMIDGVEVGLGIKASTANRCSDTDAFLTKDGTNTTGTDQSTGTNVTATEVQRTYGGATNLMGATLTAADVKASTFGWMYRLLQGLGATTAQVDYVWMKVYYTPPPFDGKKFFNFF